jgi:hypothetical protein
MLCEIKLPFYVFLQSHEGINDLAYWLSTTSTLLFYLHCTLKVSNNTNKALSRYRNSPATLFGKMAQVSFQETAKLKSIKLDLIHIHCHCKDILHCQTIIIIRLLKTFDFNHNYFCCQKNKKKNYF